VCPPVLGLFTPFFFYRQEYTPFSFLQEVYDITEWMGYAALENRRKEVFETVYATDDSMYIPDKPRRVMDRPQIIHPYIGFVNDPQRHYAADLDKYSWEAAEFSFPYNETSLFLKPSEEHLIVAI